LSIGGKIYHAANMILTGKEIKIAAFNIYLKSTFEDGLKFFAQPERYYGVEMMHDLPYFAT